LPFVDASLLIPTVLFVIGILLYRGELPRWFEGGAIPPTPGGEGGGTPPPPAAVPAPTPSRPMRPPQPPSPLGQLTIGVALLATGGLLIADRLSPLVDAGWRHYLALAMAILGLGLLVGAVWGRARWLIGLGIMIVPFLVASSVWEFSDLQINETFRPETFDDLATTLERGTGSLTIDLTRLPWDGQVYELDAALGVGEIILIIPQNVAMDLRTQVGIGLIQGGGGFGIDQELTWEGEDGAMVLDVQVGIGQIQIETSEVSDEAGAQTTDTGDLFVKVEHEEGLDDSYVTMDGSIDLDLSAVELTGDRFIALETLAGSIRVVVPKDVSYRIRAHSDLGNISLFGEDVLPSGTVRSDSILATGPVLELEIYTSEGEIVVLMEGDRS
ncbi:MAG: hypothetical protein Q8Q52_06870, partial [Acidimicrobiia bacterium]|nr:hypothetical protein [Acidimicrobiia bacterium]